MDSGRNPRELSLADRLDLLERGGVITALARRLTEDAIPRMEAFVGGALDEEAGDQLVTHIAMALTRVEKGEPEQPMPDLVAAELADRVEERAFADALTGEWRQAFGRPIPDAEVGYLVAHLAVLRERARSAP